MDKIKIKDKEFEKSIAYEEIKKAIREVAENINRDYEGEDTPLFLSILNGAFMFTADLFKELSINSEVSFVKFSSYRGTSSSGKVKELIGLNEDLSGRHVIIMEDIVDTGLTINNVIRQIESYNPKDVKVATLLFKPDACVEEVSLDYVGMEIPNEFIVGYGLDYDGLGRNLKDIYKVCSK
jgi:hypoxanthine phosphoribosyltransferase